MHQTVQASEFFSLTKEAFSSAFNESLAPCLSEIVSAAVSLLSSHGGGIYLLHEDTGELQLVYESHRPELVGRTLRLGEGLAGTLLEGDQEVLFIDDYAQYQRRASMYSNTGTFEAVAETKVQWRGRALGVLYVDFPKGTRPSSAELDALRVLGRHAGLLLVKSRVAEAERIRLKRLLAVHEESIALQHLARTAGKAILLDEAASALRRLIPCECSCIHLRDGNHLLLTSSSGHRRGTFRKGKRFEIVSRRRGGLLGHIAATGELFAASGTELKNHCATKGTRPAYLPSQECFSLLAVPIWSPDTAGPRSLLGLLQADNRLGRDHKAGPAVCFSSSDSLVAELFSKTLAAQILMI